MKTNRYTEVQIIAILPQAEGGVPGPELCREHGMSDASFYKWLAKYGGMDASMVSVDGRGEPSTEADVCGPGHAERFVEGRPWKKVDCPSQRG